MKHTRKKKKITLKEAIQKKKYVIVKKLLKRGEKGDLFTLDMIEARNTRIFRYLVKYGGIKPKRRNLIHACKKGAYGIVKFLVKKGYVIPDTKLLKMIIDGEKRRTKIFKTVAKYVTPTKDTLKYAIQQGHRRIVKHIMIRYGIIPVKPVVASALSDRTIPKSLRRFLKKKLKL